MTEKAKLEELIEQIDDLKRKNVTSYSPEFKAWHVAVKRWLAHNYGENGLEYREFVKTSFSLHIYSTATPSYEFARACADGLDVSRRVLESYLEELTENTLELGNCDTDISEKDYSKVFIVHGHDEILKEQVARTLEKQGIEVVILSERVNRGLTLIEKLERESNVAGAICLLTPDDVGKANDEDEYKSRARQNVIFEAGYFYGKLGRENVVFISNKEVDHPTDIQGIVYTNSKYWRDNLLDELKDMGYQIDKNR